MKRHIAIGPLVALWVALTLSCDHPQRPGEIADSASSMSIACSPIDTMSAGDTAKIIGVIIGKNGDTISDFRNFISWEQVHPVLSGDSVLITEGNCTRVTAISAHRRLGIVGSYTAPTKEIRDTFWIVIRPNRPSQVDIVLCNSTPLTKEQAIARIDSFAARPAVTICLDTNRPSIYAYAVLRDCYGNFTGTADSAAWTGLSTGMMSVAETRGKRFEGVVALSAGVVKGNAAMTVSQGMLKPDTAMIVVDNSKAFVDSAITRDTSGNGYIDNIELFFNKEVNIAPDDTVSFAISYKDKTLRVDNIMQMPGFSYRLCIKEQYYPMPQTSWNPNVSIINLPSILNVSPVCAIDGCPPAVWMVRKVFARIADQPDTVLVDFSEKIRGSDGRGFALSTKPLDVFAAWQMTDSGFVRVDGMFDGIPSFAKIEGDSVVTFAMANGKDLNDRYFLNIRAENKTLADRNGNFPTECNQRVRVLSLGCCGSK